MTVAKAGFLFSGRIGFGLVVARLKNGSWSAPSAIGTASFGAGLQIGAELTDFVIILNNDRAVDAFSHDGNVAVGGNLSVALGPTGRDMEASGMATVAAIYSYSKTRGLFAGISIEGTVFVERQDANEKFYGRRARAYELLGGTIPPPAAGRPLYEALKFKEIVSKEILPSSFYAQAPGSASRPPPPTPAAAAASSSSSSSSPSTNPFVAPGPPPYAERVPARLPPTSTPARLPPTSTPVGAAQSKYPVASVVPVAAPRAPVAAPRAAGGSGAAPPLPQRHGLRGKALFKFAGQQDGDLPFNVGDIIDITEKTSSQNDWWKGSCKGKSGSFPGNYVELL